MAGIELLLLLGGLAFAASKGWFDNIFSSNPQTPPPTGGGGGSTGNLPPGTPFKFSAAGDFRTNKETSTNLASGSPDIVVLEGDYSYSGGAQSWWTGNMAPINNLKVIGALGNHDDDTFKDLWPLNQGKWEFIHKVSNVAFVAVDTEANDPSSTDTLLQQAQADPEVAHIIPFMHKTVFTPTAKPLSTDASSGYHAVFAKYDKIRMVMGGHNHFYTRMNPVAGANFIYVTIGNGGANPHSDSEEPAGNCHYHLTNGCLHCDVNNDTISCNMISNEGKTHDTFTIKPGQMPTDGCEAANAPTGGDSETANDADNQATYARARLARAYHIARFTSAGRYMKMKTPRTRMR